MRDDIDKALAKFKNAIIRAWVLDTADELFDKDRRSTKEAHGEANEAEKQLRRLLEDL